jgi:hypothetical protein
MDILPSPSALKLVAAFDPKRPFGVITPRRQVMPYNKIAQSRCAYLMSVG